MISLGRFQLKTSLHQAAYYRRHKPTVQSHPFSVSNSLILPADPIIYIYQITSISAAHQVPSRDPVAMELSQVQHTIEDKHTDHSHLISVSNSLILPADPIVYNTSNQFGLCCTSAAIQEASIHGAFTNAASSDADVAMTCNTAGVLLKFGWWQDLHDGPFAR